MGSGLVHTAPGHGAEDFELHEADPETVVMRCPVNQYGKYTREVGLQELEGLAVLGQGGKAVLEILANTPGRLVHAGDWVHRYPYDWRTKKPIITRATRQWFVQLEGLRSCALDEVAQVEFIPSSGAARLSAMLQGRAEWCISRQRVWGTPIPVFHRQGDDDQDEVLVDPKVIEHVAALIEQHSGDIWWDEPSCDQLLPEEYRGQGWQRGRDTLDIWLDSGSSWRGVLQERKLPFPADLYLEGSDQHRGWFQSSLLTSVALTGQAPYKSVVTHGFVLDSKGRKMSKSVGNVVEPAQIVEGGKNKKQHPPYGADVMRWWVASCDYTRDVVVGDNVLATAAENYRKVRNCTRFLLGNTSDFSMSEDRVPYNELPEVDRFMLHQLHQWQTNVAQHYDAFEYSKVVKLVGQFVSQDLSAFYFEIAKDRLYADGATSHSRRSCQTVLCSVLQSVSCAVSPVLCHFAQDVHQHDPNALGEAAFRSGWMSNVLPEWHDPELASRWQELLALRSEVNKCLETVRADKTLASNGQASISVALPDASTEQRQFLADSLGGDALARLFLASTVDVSGEESSQEVIREWDGEWNCEGGKQQVKIAVSATQHGKCARCWRFDGAPGAELCMRCQEVIGLDKIGEIEVESALPGLF